MDELLMRRAETIKRLAKLENRDGAEMCRLVVDAGIRVLMRKHRIGCGFDGCRKRCCAHPRGQMRLVWPEDRGGDS